MRTDGDAGSALEPGAPAVRGTIDASRAFPPAGVAQLVEQLIRNQQVIGSSPIAGSNVFNNLKGF